MGTVTDGARVCVQAVLQSVCVAARESALAKTSSPISASFYAVLICEVIAAAPVDDTLLATLLPNILAGIKPGIPAEFRSATFMLIAQLSSHAELEHAFLESLLEDLCKHNSGGEGVSELLMLLSHMFSTQSVLTRFPDKAFNHIIKAPELAAEIGALHERGVGVNAVVGAIAATLAVGVAAHDKYGGVLAELLQEVHSPEAAGRTAQLVLQAVVDALVTNAAQSADADGTALAGMLAGVEPVLRVLETRYPLQVRLRAHS